MFIVKCPNSAKFLKVESGIFHASMFLQQVQLGLQTKQLFLVSDCLVQYRMHSTSDLFLVNASHVPVIYIATNHLHFQNTLKEWS